MVIPAEKGDSETDSSDLIICGPTQVCDREEILKKTQIYEQQMVTKQSMSLCLYSWVLGPSVMTLKTRIHRKKLHKI